MGTATVDRVQYSDREKAKILALVDTGMSLRAVSRQTGVPFQTIARWKDGLGTNDDVSQDRDALNASLAARFEDVANKLVYSVARMTDDEMSLATVSQRMTGAAIAVDKMRLLRGEDVSQIDNAIADGIRLRAMAELAKMMAERQGGVTRGSITVSGTTDVVIHPAVGGSTDGGAVGVGDAALVAQHATGDATVDIEAGAGSLGTVAVLGICMICGELPADKTTRGGANVCSVCIP